MSYTFQSEQVTFLSIGKIHLKQPPFLFLSGTELDKLKASNTVWNAELCRTAQMTMGGQSYLQKAVRGKVNLASTINIAPST